MRRGHTGQSRSGRSSGVVPMVAAVASAIALTGAAFYTVEQATCGDPAQYIRHDNHVELVGGCVDGADLPATGPGQVRAPEAGAAEPANYRP
ncbi:hypothetical protein CFN78_08770 [Amycolatopsis antarctica]|uniref:Uncharacterized protein n=1 Tax=Amycolatopsis antarctica TaxID=1854586 RepID=A0A263D5F7_9PSEU|nr:hypothetical protein [Amycolatopsis antarctica]OZM73611.1 hypothetical protein CFN78_08770 [Amycolatopsis antarctica]